MQVPPVSIVTVKPDTVHTDSVNEVTVTVKPESDVAVTVNGDAEYSRLFGCVNVINCEEPVGDTTSDEVEPSESPTLLVAVTVNLYDTPLVNPNTTHDVAEVVQLFEESSNAVTVYSMIAEPPSDTGAVHDTITSRFPATADTPVGASGRNTFGVAVTILLADPGPTTFRARIVTEYVVPLITEELESDGSLNVTGDETPTSAFHVVPLSVEYS